LLNIAVKMIRFLKVLAINLATFALLLVLINWACGVYLKSAADVKREQLPNYASNYAYAEKVFHDYNRVQHQYEPFVGWKTLPYQGATLHISAEGKRTHPAPPEKKVRAVHFFGGSTMWGEGSDDEHTIPALFNAKNPQYEVHNHAQLAYNTRQELDALISLYAVNTKPDIVVFYDGVNDAAFLCPKDIKKLPAHRLVPMYRDKLYVGKTAMIKEMAAKLFIENTLKVVRKFTYKPSPDRSPYDCLSNPEKAEQIASMMMMNWEMAHEIVTSRGGKFIAILQPAAFVGNPRTEHLQLDEELGKNFQEIYRRIKQKISERGHPWIFDLSDKFDGNDYIYIDFCHVSPNGNEIMAGEISNIIGNLNKTGDVALFALHP
jgi:hypothetical protein